MYIIKIINNNFQKIYSLIVDPMEMHNKEIMTYNTSNLLEDFEDDMFLGASSASPANMVTDGNGGGDLDPLEFTDNKGIIFDSLISNNNASQT